MGPGFEARADPARLPAFAPAFAPFRPPAFALAPAAAFVPAFAEVFVPAFAAVPGLVFAPAPAAAFAVVSVPAFAPAPALVFAPVLAAAFAVVLVPAFASTPALVFVAVFASALAGDAPGGPAFPSLAAGSSSAAAGVFLLPAPDFAERGAEAPRAAGGFVRAAFRVEERGEEPFAGDFPATAASWDAPSPAAREGAAGAVPSLPRVRARALRRVDGRVVLAVVATVASEGVGGGMERIRSSFLARLRRRRGRPRSRAAEPPSDRVRGCPPHQRSPPTSEARKVVDSILVGKHRPEGGRRAAGIYAPDAWLHPIRLINKESRCLGGQNRRCRGLKSARQPLEMPRIVG